jgi:hypothetical protein
LTYATRFDGSLFTAPLMTLANLYVLCWNYEKWKNILPFNRLANEKNLESGFAKSADGGGIFSRYGIRPLSARFLNFLRQLFSKKFPFLKNFPYLFFAGVFAAIVIFVIVIPNLYSVKPRNTFEKCQTQFKNSSRKKAGEIFCGCIHNKGEPLNKCLSEYNNAPDDDDSSAP